VRCFKSHHALTNTGWLIANIYATVLSLAYRTRAQFYIGDLSSFPAGHCTTPGHSSQVCVPVTITGKTSVTTNVEAIQCSENPATWGDLIPNSYINYRLSVRLGTGAPGRAADLA